MKLFIKLCFYIVTFIVFLSCAGSRNPIFESIVASPMNPVTYTGKVLCPDCNGPNLMLKLRSDRSYEAEMVEAGTGERIRNKGVYTWKKKRIILAGDSLFIPANFIVGDKELIPDDTKDGSISINSLTLLENSPEEQNWKLVELNGKPIKSINDPVRYPHFTLKLLTDRIVGNGGCNGFSGYYEIHAGSIRFSDLISTKMACMEVDYETDFLTALGNTDNYVFRNDSLYLRRSDIVLARLIAFEQSGSH